MPAGCVYTRINSLFYELRYADIGSQCVSFVLPSKSYQMLEAVATPETLQASRDGFVNSCQ